MRFNPHTYQVRAIDHILANPFCGLFLDMGMGKTVSTLTAIDRLIYDRMETLKVLVIAPKRVAEDTWTTEAAKWDHLRHLRIAKVLGDTRDREKALETTADIWVTNRENVEWLAHRNAKRWPFDMVVIDELSSFKNPYAKRFKALRKVRPQIRRLVGLTGTPSPNGLLDLWAEVYLMDQGQRLGRTLGSYRATWFTPGAHNGAVVYDWRPRPGASEAVTAAIRDICMSMTAEDYLSLPDLMVTDWPVLMDAATSAKYARFVRDLVVQLDGQEVTATTAAALSGKLQQFIGGAIYDKDKACHEIWTGKLDALREIVEQADGPVLVYYSYIHERERILAGLQDYHPETLDGSETISRWNAGGIRVLLAHPASAGHGLNLQAGGHVMVWFSLTWSCEQYLQANARLHRQGQQKPVMLYRLVCPGTVDERIVTALERKERAQDAVIDAVKYLIKTHEQETSDLRQGDA